MADAKPVIVAEWVEAACVDQPVIRLREMLPSVLRRYYKNSSDEELADFSEALEEPVARCLQERAALALNDGVKVPFELSSEGKEFYITALPGPELALLKKLRASSPEAFEHFCKKLVEKLGGVAQVTGGTADGGIDFFGYGLPIQVRDLPLHVPS